uniref:DUF4605 domain-containing protein n=1 Tax=Monodelphis domestica TaxID=13616 RepID=F6Z6R7_MONDO
MWKGPVQAQGKSLAQDHTASKEQTRGNGTQVLRSSLYLLTLPGMLGRTARRKGEATLGALGIVQVPSVALKMVRILANGDIVQDDDPRARASAPFRNITSRQNFFTRGEGQLHGGPAPNIHHLGPRPGAHRSPFSDINQQLVNLGFPLWHLGDQVVEPVMSILLLFLVMMLGVRGLLLVGLVYMVSQLSLR